MSWIILALVARFLWSWGNIADKFLLSKKVKDPLVYLVMVFLADVVVVPLWLFFGFHWYGWGVFGLIALNSVFFFTGTFFYILAVQKEEISRVNLLWNLSPLHGLWLSWFILGEFLSYTQLFGLLILLFGSILAGLHLGNKKEKTKLSIGFWFMLLSTLIYAGGDIITHYLTGKGVPALQIAGYQLCLLPCLALFMYLSKNFRQRFVLEKRNYNLQVILILIVFAFLSRIGVLFNMKALGLGHISLINVLEGFQSIMVFVIVAILSFFAPKIIKEEFDKKNLILKLVALVIMISGILVLNLL